jgi:hypothetical protein
MIGWRARLYQRCDFAHESNVAQNGSLTSSRRRSQSDTIADQDDAHPHIETTDEPGAEAQGGLAMYQGQLVVTPILVGLVVPPPVSNLVSE